MTQLGLFARLEAKPGKEEAVAALLRTGLEMAQNEVGTPLWFALRLGPSTFGIFDAFYNERDRQTHLDGAIAQALMEQAPSLLAQAPSIEKLEVLGSKVDR